MARYLVVANQTIGGEALMDEIRRRLADERASFFVLVPNTVPADIEWSVVGEGFAGSVAVDETALQPRATMGAMFRLRQLIRQIQEEGGEADGDLGPPDPFAAADAVLTREPFDEVIVSTLPSGISRWLRRDLPHRVERKHRIPVTTVTMRV